MLPPQKMAFAKAEARREIVLGLALVAMAWIGIGTILFAYAPLIQCQTQLTSDVAAACSRALQRGLFPSSWRPDMHSSVIYHLRNTQEHQRVLDALAVLEQEQALPADMLVIRAQALSGLNKVPESYATYRIALKTEPTHEDSFIGLVNLSIAKADHETARNDAAAFRTHNPQSKTAWTYSGQIELLDDRYDQAIAYYKQTTVIDPTSSNAHYDLGYVLQLSNRYDEALAAYNAAVELSPDSEYVLKGRAELHTLRGDHRAAQADYLKGLEIYREIHTLVRLGKSYGQTGDIVQALVYLDEAIAQDPSVEFTHVAKLRVLVGNGKYPEAAAAIKDLENAVPGSSQPVYWKTILAEKQKSLLRR